MRFSWLSLSKAEQETPPNDLYLESCKFCPRAAPQIDGSPSEERPTSSRAGFLAADAAQPVGSPPGAELALLSVVSAVPLLTRSLLPRLSPVGPRYGRGLQKQASDLPTKIGSSLSGEFLKQFIPFN